MLLLFIAIAVLGYAVYVAAEAATAPARDHERSLRRASRYGLIQIRAKRIERLRFHERVITPALHRLAAIALRVNPKATLESISGKLLASGLASRISPTQFLALKSALSVACCVTFALLSVARSPAMIVLMAPAGLALGFLAPDTFLTMKARSRREAIRGQLPDALDILAVSVEAGLGLDGAIVKVTEHMQGPLIDEFALTLGEIRIGESRHEALK